MKAVLILLAVAFVASFISIGAGSLTSNSQQPANTSSDPITAAGQQYQPAVASLTGQLQSQPESATLLIALGNTYFDWASQVQQVSQTATSAVGADQPLWISAKDAYSRAVKAGASQPPVMIDYAITQHYTGETSGALATALAVSKSSPEFAPAWFNLGIFYQATGDSAKALVAFNRYLKLDPKGTQGNAEYAKQQVKTLQGQSTATTTP